MSAIGTDEEDDRALAGEYALGLMDEAQALAFEARLATEPGLRAEYALWVEHLARLTDEIAPVAPPARVYDEIAGRIFAEAERPRARIWQRLGIGALLAASAVMLAVWLGPDWGARAPRGDMLATLSAENGDVLARAGWDGEARVLDIARAAPPPEPGRAYELWLIAGDAAPVSLGLLPGPERGLITVPEALAAQVPGAVLAISDEPTGGSPTGQPTGAVLALGPVITSS